MKVIIGGNTLLLVRQQGDKPIPRITKTSFSPHAESILLRRLQRELMQFGVDLVKRRMSKDGHLVDSHQMYLVSRSQKCPYAICILNSSWSIRDAGEEYRQRGTTTLTIIPHIFGPGSTKKSLSQARRKK